MREKERKREEREENERTREKKGEIERKRERKEKSREKERKGEKKREKMFRVNYYQSAFNSQKEKLNILAEMLEISKTEWWISRRELSL